MEIRFELLPLPNYYTAPAHPDATDAAVYMALFLCMTLFFWKFIPAKQTALYNFFLAKMCRNVQITLGMNPRHSLGRPKIYPNFPAAPQTKNGNHFFLPTSQKINTFIEYLTNLQT